MFNLVSMKIYKTILLAMCAVCISLVSCDKDDDNGGTPNGSETYLPKKIYGTAADGVEWSAEFEYDNQNRLTKATFPHKEYIMDISYPAGKVCVIKYVDTKNGEAYRIREAEISGNLLSITATDLDFPSDLGTWTYTVENGKIEYDHNAKEVYNYDASGNLVKRTAYNWNLTFKYDNKKGIFSNINTPAWLLWDLDVDYIWEGLFFVCNNLTEYDHSSEEKGEHSSRYEYNYNNDGYPVSFKYNHTWNGEEEPEMTVYVEYN